MARFFVFEKLGINESNLHLSSRSCKNAVDTVQLASEANAEAKQELAVVKEARESSDTPLK